MLCCGKTADRMKGKAGPPGCVLWRICQILTRKKTPRAILASSFRAR